MNIRDLGNFDKMITPVIIKILFYIGVALAVIGGLIAFFGGIFSAFQQGSIGPAIGGLIGGPLVIILGILLARVYAELLIVVFQIHQNLVAIKKKMVDGE
ncbi:MAG: DUF4282 domain-containing protein [Anaerolineaceae bacterium]|jgi:hypothetical protein|nr:DUF4282 domain-containing protein [Anaerolineaceae bacterium]MDD4042839.1 DUF4282 domain-containing protein [Anaerolineaceae bacterium]MDD4578679.1 DUF4282 domain-containing protein [Anaerolineaceae bacterium]